MDRLLSRCQGIEKCCHPSGDDLCLKFIARKQVEMTVVTVAGPLIEHAELIDGPYNLEVSSPGAERPLRSHGDYERFNGKRVNIRYRSGDADTVVEGQLVAVDGAGIAVQALGARGRAPVVLHIAWSDVVAGRLAVAL